MPAACLDECCLLCTELIQSPPVGKAAAQRAGTGSVTEIQLAVSTLAFGASYQRPIAGFAIRLPVSQTRCFRLAELHGRRSNECVTIGR
jgi:hypothetical protein